MADSEKYLSFSNLQNEQAVVGFCSICGERFETKPAQGKRIDDLILEVRADFDAHLCGGNPPSL
jgi:hypothetical protein